jgi:M6 family metalloprotease-like protein
MFLSPPRPAAPAVRRHPVGLLIGLLALALLVPASVTASDNVELTGEIVVEYAEDFDTHRIERWTILETARGRVRLEGHLLHNLEPGTRVRARGKLRGESLELAAVGGSLTTLSEPSETTTAATAGVRNVAVLLFNFDGSRPWTRSTVRGVYFNNERAVSNYFAEVSNDQLTLTGEVYGWFTITAPTNSCRQSEWGLAARQAATDAGVDLSGYDYIVHAFPRTSACWWGGLAQVAGKYSWINGAMTPYVTMHETGHNLGAHHASSMTCHEHGVRVPLSDNCTVSEYGDPHDVMGQNASGPSKQRHLHAWHRRQVGFLASSAMRTVTSAGRHTIAPAAVAGNSPRLLRVPRASSGDYFYLEYRRPYGVFDDYSTSAHAVNGVLVRIAPASARVPSRLIDMNPSTTGFGDAALAAGQTFTDRINGVRIRTVSVSSIGAVVDIEFDTQAPGAPGNVRATQTGARQVTISWTAASDNYGVTGYRVRRDGSLLAKVKGISFVDNSVQEGRSYRYEVRAEDGAGNRGPITAASPSPIAVLDVTPPSAPTDLTATTSGSTVNLAWGAATDNVGVTGYRVLRNGSQVASLGASARSFSQSSVPAGSHTYGVRAIDAAGNLGPTASVTVSIASMTTASTPSVPQGLAAKVLADGRVELTWNASSGGTPPLTYRVFRNGTGSANRIATDLAKASHVDNPPVGTHSYTVRARDAAGNMSSHSAKVTATVASTADTTPPTRPTGLTATARDGRYVDLKWNPSTDDRPGLITYRVFRDGTGSANRIATDLTATSFTDRPSAGTHSYTVRARDAAGNLSSHSAKVTVTAADKVGSPSVPTNLTGKAQDKRYVQLSWGASSGGSGSLTYRIFRNDVRIATGVTTTSYRDRAPTVGNHTYKVRAVDSKGNKSKFTPKITVRAVKAV